MDSVRKAPAKAKLSSLSPLIMAVHNSVAEKATGPGDCVTDVLASGMVDGDPVTKEDADSKEEMVAEVNAVAEADMVAVVLTDAVGELVTTSLTECQGVTKEV